MASEITEDIIKIEETEINYSIKSETEIDVVEKDVPEFVNVNQYAKENLPNAPEVKEPFHCKYCPKKYSVLKCVKLHEYTHKEQYRCPCGKEFMRCLEFKSHVNKHIRDIMKEVKRKDLCCKICNKYFKTRAHLRNHGTVHRTDRLYKCKVCGNEYKQRNYLSKHLKEKHVERTSYPCLICSVYFPYIKDLREHLKQCHSNFCNRERRNSKKSKLNSKSSKSGTRQFYKCALCGEMFSNRGQYLPHRDNHMLYGLGEIQQAIEANLFTCKICLKNCTSVKNLFLHMDTHMDSTYKCSGCSELFSFYRFAKHINSFECTIKNKTNG